MLNNKNTMEFKRSKHASNIRILDYEELKNIKPICGTKTPDSDGSPNSADPISPNEFIRLMHLIKHQEFAEKYNCLDPTIKKQEAEHKLMKLFRKK